jgi:hypothetical protein
MKTNFFSVNYWAMGSSMVVFLKEVYGLATEAGNFLMSHAAAITEAHVEHDCGFVILGHAGTDSK